MYYSYEIKEWLYSYEITCVLLWILFHFLIIKHYFLKLLCFIFYCKKLQKLSHLYFIASLNNDNLQAMVQYPTQDIQLGLFHWSCSVFPVYFSCFYNFLFTTAFGIVICCTFLHISYDCGLLASWIFEFFVLYNFKNIFGHDLSIFLSFRFFWGLQKCT